MKRYYMVLMMLMIGLVATGLGSASDDVSEAEKAAFHQRVNQELQTLDDKIEQLEHRTQQLEGQAQAEATLIMRDLRQRQEEVRERIGRVRVATGAHWDEVKAEINEAVSKLYASYDQAAERLQ